MIAEDRRLLGFITDGDVRRALRNHDDIRPLRASAVMTASPVHIGPEALVHEALRMMEDRPSQIYVLPVLDADTRVCLGLLRLHDIYQAAAGRLSRLKFLCFSADPRQRYPMRIVSLLLFASVAALAGAGGGLAVYVVGNLDGVSPGDEGTLVLDHDAVVFRSGNTVVSVPYDDIHNVELGTRVMPPSDAPLYKVWRLPKRFLTERAMHQMVNFEFADKDGNDQNRRWSLTKPRPTKRWWRSKSGRENARRLNTPRMEIPGGATAPGKPVAITIRWLQSRSGLRPASSVLQAIAPKNHVLVMLF